MYTKKISFIPLLLLILAITACTAASPTATQLDQSVNTPSVPPSVIPASTLPPSLEPSPVPSVAPIPTDTLVPTTIPPAMGGSGVILFGSNRDGDYMNLYLLELAGESVTSLTMENSNIFPGPFSPDGTRILYTGFGLTNSFVGVMNADGTNMVDLSGNPQYDEGFPGWSPDGNQIVFYLPTGWE